MPYYGSMLNGATMNRLALLALAALLTGCSSIRPLVIATHVSDPSDSGQSDTTVDFLGAGITAGRAGFSIDAALGRKAINCDARGSCPSTLGGMATIKWSPK